MTRPSGDARRDPLSAEAGKARTWILAFIVAAAGTLGIMVGVGCAIGANACPFTDPAPVARTTGAEIFAADCALCHGPRGEGGRGPSLVAGEAAARTFEELVNKIGRGSPGLMPRFRGKLTPAQIELVARHVMQLRGDP